MTIKLGINGLGRIGRMVIRSIVENKNNCTLTQTAFFAPKGLLGLLYWYSLFPIHIFIFKGMIKAIKNRVLKQY